METAAQPETMPEHNFDWINALSDEACRLHDAAVEAYGDGHIEVAEGFFRRSITLFEQVEGLEHPDVAAALSNLGAMLEDQCDYLGAEECYERAAAIMEVVEDDGADEDVTRLRLQTMNNLGRIHRIQGH